MRLDGTLASTVGYNRPFTRPGFLDGRTCRHLRRAMDRGAADEAEVLDLAIISRPAVRRARAIEVDRSALDAVEGRLDRCRRAISDYYAVPLVEREGAGFIRYPEGGFYRAHRDRADDPSWPDAARRSIAAVVFLNDDFEGGLLRLFVGRESLDITPEEGLLVAFPADVLHEVTVVARGTRDAVVDWFYGREPGASGKAPGPAS